MVVGAVQGNMTSMLRFQTEGVNLNLNLIGNIGLTPPPVGFILRDFFCL